MNTKMMVIIITTIIIVTAIMVTTGHGDDVSVAPVVETHEITVDDRKTSAADAGEFVITRHDDGYDGRVAIFTGLDIPHATVRTDKHYRIPVQPNLFIRQRDNGGDWVTVQSIMGNAGDYIIITTGTNGVNAVSVR